jgi:hypothetical protein
MWDQVRDWDDLPRLSYNDDHITRTGTRTRTTSSSGKPEPVPTQGRIGAEVAKQHRTRRRRRERVHGVDREFVLAQRPSVEAGGAGSWVAAYIKEITSSRIGAEC